jgi:DNA-directed RNA polymerase specialized sigma24 family protein
MSLLREGTTRGPPMRVWVGGRCERGRKQATFEQFVRGQLRPLLRMATATSLNPALAEDLVQVVLIKVMRGWDHVSTRDDPATVLPDDDQPDPAAALAERADLVSQLAVLPRRQRVVLALRYFEDMDDADIAAFLGCRPGTVRGYASRALATLRKAAVEEHALERGTH